IRPRTWHVIKLTEQIKDEPINTFIRLLPSRIVEALKNSQSAVNGNKRPQVQTIKLGDLIFISIQMVSNLKQGGVLYVASPPGQAVALVSTLHSNLLRACVQGLGYKKFEDACLNGKDIPSLLRIFDNGNNTATVTDMPEFVATPCIARGGIDFTNSQATKNYLSQMFGPAPPILDTLTVKSETDFFDSAILNKRMKVILQIKSENTFSTLQKWAEIAAISPTSELFQVFHTIKSNQIQISNDEDDE
ncbi:jg25717, partial [Pararge aegeria aegeria]